MERRKKFFLKERFLQSRQAFLLLEALLCLSLLSFALILFLKYLSTPKTLPSTAFKSPFNSLQSFSSSQKVLLKSGELEFEATQKIWDDKRERFVILEDFK